jgi:hypothetical protein
VWTTAGPATDLWRTSLWWFWTCAGCGDQGQPWPSSSTKPGYPARIPAPTRSTCRGIGKSVAGLRNCEKRTTTTTLWVGLQTKRIVRTPRPSHVTHKARMVTGAKPESMLERGNKPASSAGTAFLPFLSAKTASSFGEGSFVQSMSKTIGSACLPLVRPSWVAVWGQLCSAALRPWPGHAFQPSVGISWVALGRHGRFSATRRSLESAGLSACPSRSISDPKGLNP